MLWQHLGAETWMAAVFVAAGAFGRIIKKLWPSMPSPALPAGVIAFAYLLIFGDQLLGGAALSAAASTALWGLLAGSSAVGGHELFKKLLVPIVGEQRAELVLGKLGKTAAAKSSSASIVFVGCVCLSMVLPGCPALISGLAKAADGASWLGAVIDGAADGAKAYFARHPNQEAEQQVGTALDDARDAAAALESAARTAEAAGGGDISETREHAVETYLRLLALFDRLGITTARAPAGGAETDAPLPKPLELPDEAAVRSHLGP